MEQDNKVNVAKSRLSVGYTNNDNQMLQFWKSNNTFKEINQLFKKKFTLLDGPPYANGQAHLGHALNKMLKNLVVKSRWFLGESVDYRSGWDCHGLPLELLVEKQYGKLETTVMKKRCKQLAFRSVVKQRNTFKRLGVLSDWKNPYLTLSQDMLKSSTLTVKKLFDDDLLTYKRFPVHYCPTCASSLADAELESKLLSKDSLYFKMKVFSKKYNNLYALVWTTTTWTLPMNQGLAYQKDFTYEVWGNNTEQLVLQQSDNQSVLDYLETHNYSFLTTHKGVDFDFNKGISPLTQKEVPVLHADFLEEGKTGFVHLAFSHGVDDFELGLKNELHPHTFLNKNGLYEGLESTDLHFLNLKKHTQVSELLTNFLTTKNLLVDYSTDMVEQDVCWRHKTSVYFNATWQVFLNLENPANHLKNKVQNLLNSSEMQPHYKKRLSSLLLARKNWCLSRQRKLGCPLNLLVDKESKQLDKLSSQYLDYLLNNLNKEAQQLLTDNPHLEVFDDVLDVWFDSGNVANNYKQHNKTNQHYVADLVLEGKDQFRGWFQSLLWLTVAAHNTLPYNKVLSHGFVLDDNRNKFAKSAGNCGSVEHYADLYGADVLHLWTASQDPELDSVFSTTKLDEMKRMYSRLRLSLRFMTSNLYDYDHSQHTKNLEQFSTHPSFELHLFVLKEMKTLHNQFSDLFKQFQFKKALELLYNFSDKTLSNFYYDWAKNPLYLLNKNNEHRTLVQCGMFEVMLGLFDLVKVFTPFVAEEFFQDYFNNSTSVYQNNYFTTNKKVWLSTQELKTDFKSLLKYRKEVLAEVEKLQQDKSVKSRAEVSANLYLDSEELENLSYLNNHYSLSDLMGISEVMLNTNNNQDKVVLKDLKKLTDYSKCSRCWTYKKLVNFKHELCEHCCTEV